MKAFWGLVLAAAVVAGLSMFAFGDDDDARRGRGWHGSGDWMDSGMMGGGGPGMMGGGGPGMMGGGMMGPGMMYWGLENGLSKEQIDKLDQLQSETARSMRDAMFANRDRMREMHDVMHKFPLDEKAAMEQWKAMNTVRESMFRLHVDSIAKAQQIMGGEKWEEMTEDLGGWGGPGRGRGPGMMRNR